MVREYSKSLSRVRTCLPTGRRGALPRFTGPCRDRYWSVSEANLFDVIACLPYQQKQVRTLDVSENSNQPLR
jgi:hypothetical protein